MTKPLKTVYCSIISSGLEAWSDIVVRATGLRAQTLTYRLQDKASHLVVWLPNRYDLGTPGKALEWRDARFFLPDQEDKAIRLAEPLKALAPIQTVWVAQARNQYWYVQVKLSRQWQNFRCVFPPAMSNPVPYSRVLPKAQALELPTWYGEARQAGYQSISFKYGEDWLVVHLPQALVIGVEGKGKWEDWFFFEEEEDARRFAACLRSLDGIKAAHNGFTGNPCGRRWTVSVSLDVPTTEPSSIPTADP